nr:NS5 [Epizootic hemorrhagic disease virus]WOJ52277.1 NS5 [Epizootic hemorrhagic disease virus]
MCHRLQYQQQCRELHWIYWIKQCQIKRVQLWRKK